jgi:UDP-N-acetylglucosamine--N-acetylmuramyl-(pentapeptide) pyrophosphoryl-undecaprenol N-acetylglucosamine transferase
MAAADLIICRAGANTIAELCATGRASVLVPSPFVPKDHQTPNAAAMERAGASVMMREADCSAGALFERTLQLLGDKQKLREMERCALALGDANAAEKLAREMIQMVRE